MLAAIWARLYPGNARCRRRWGVALILIAALAGAIALYGRPHLVYHGKGGVDLAPQLQKMKGPSLKPWKNALIAGEGLHKFAYARLATTIRGSTQIEIADEAPEKNGPINVAIRLDETGGVGSAAVVSHDGYILTAAHCIGTGPLVVVIKAGGRKLEQMRPRVVWKGEPDTDSAPDLALLHVDHKFPSVFTLGSAEDISKGIPVLSSGYGLFDEANCAGIIRRVRHARSNASGARWMVFEHDAPITPGDSGGPAFGLQGQLLGVNVQARIPALRWRDETFILRHRGTSHQPDRVWLKELMEKDRRTHGKAAGSSGASTR